MDGNVGIIYDRGYYWNLFEVCFISSLMVQLLYPKEDMPTEKYGTSITESRWMKLFKYKYCQQREWTCVCGTLACHGTYVSIGLLTAAIKKRN